jgi:hypothetical protein
MSLFDDASLCVTPNGQKAGKLYSIKPSDGSGDLSVTRATSATRVDANGLIEIPRTNLVLQSQTFENASWTKTAATITANASTAPDGTLTADKFIPNTSATNHAIGSNNFALGTNTISVYAKMDGYRYLVILSATANASFDLMNGVVANNSGGGFVSYSITNAGNGWYRCVLTVNTTSISSMFISGGSSSASAFFNGAGDGTSGVLIWGAQVEAGNVVTEYIPTIASIRTKFAGITQDGSSASNIPRLDYTNGSCPSILVEPQRTNLALRSEEFDNASWTKTNTTISANTTISPNGTLTADKIIATSITGDKIVFQSLTINTGQAFTISAFFKKSEYKLAFLRAGGQTGQPYVIYNLDTQAIVSTSGASSNKIEDYGNGWYRISLTLNSSTGTLLATSVSFLPDSGYTLTAFNVPQYTGDNISGGFIWGVQAEANGASNATSYIPTTSASVTRNADVISKTGISSLIGQTEGTLFLEFNSGILNSESYVFGVNDGTGNNRILIYKSGSNTITTQIRVSNVNQALIQTTTILENTNYKCAVAYKLNDIAFYVNGSLIGTDTSATIPTCSVLKNDDGTGTSGFYRPIKSAILWKERLTNEQLSQLTTI